jgi:hypothetical protein
MSAAPAEEGKTTRLVVTFRGACLFIRLSAEQAEALDANVVVLFPSTATADEPYYVEDEHHAVIRYNATYADGVKADTSARCPISGGELPGFGKDSSWTFARDFSYCCATLGDKTSEKETPELDLVATVQPTIPPGDIVGWIRQLISGETGKLGNPLVHSALFLRGGAFKIPDGVENSLRYKWYMGTPKDESSPEKLSYVIEWECEIAGTQLQIGFAPTHKAKNTPTPINLKAVDGLIAFEIVHGAAGEVRADSPRDHKMRVGDDAPDFAAYYGPFGGGVGPVPMVASIDPVVAPAAEEKDKVLLTVVSEPCTLAQWPPS